MGDSRFESNSLVQIKGKPSNSRAINHLASIDSTPYRTARASRSEFSYVFLISPGQHFIRLHFYKNSYKGFKGSTAFFSVKAEPYTLLSNFSTSFVSNESGASEIIIKEYCVNVDEHQELKITFTPAAKMRKADDFYAFVNGIEVVSMPTGLYFTPEGEFGTRVIGKKYRFYIDNNTALELVQRLNVGGPAIAPNEDSGLFRRWDEDNRFMSGAGDTVIASSITAGRKKSMPVNISPEKIHQTERRMQATSKSSGGLTWKIPVDSGFRYLIRLHSLEFATIGEENDMKFSIVINNQIAEDSHDVIHSDGVSGDGTYRDYIVMVEGDKKLGRRCLTIALQPSFESRDQHFHGSLNGLEVFKLSNPDNSLAGMSPIPELQSSISTLQLKKAGLVSIVNLTVTVLTIVLALLNIVVYYLKGISDRNSRRTNIRLPPMEHHCRQFSINEIRAATNNFDPQFHIGSGGYGRVYKGSIDWGYTTVAIKRLRPDSRQGEEQFWTEIKMLSKIRDEHLVSLIGYCNDGQERLLVYQYMTRGTLEDHLFNINRHVISNPPLPWEQRLQVSIGAAHGLYYLHSRHGVIHRDVKSSNILLDENWVAKISDFGLSKMGPADSLMHISTNIAGTFGYLDPEYFLTRKLTRKSDVYAFGVVLFEVLSGRPAVDIRLEEEQHSLAGWARYCIREGRVDRLIDQNLMGHILPACLKVFVGIAGRCLHTKPEGRPAMADVVLGLELALLLQQTGEDIEQGDGEENAGRVYSDNSDGIISMDDICETPPKGESGRITSEEKPSPGIRNGSSDQKNVKVKKTTGSNNNGSTRWWWDPFGILPRTRSKSRASSSLPQTVIHRFSLQDIRKATNNFHYSHIIGFGGSDNVYKGHIDGIQKVVAIRWSRTTESRVAMADELKWKKPIQMRASSPGQDHIPSLIGYCETVSDMILVYDYMKNGTLYDQLHEHNMDPLPWKRRLQISIGVARGVGFIHSNVKQTKLHHDLKSTNIWLDDNWIPKVSEWGLSRKKENNQVPALGGNWGYRMDSDYIRGEQITEKSYVYSLGLILFEVLFAEQESDRWFDEDQVSLACWIKSEMRNNPSGCIDPFLIGRVSPASRNIYLETAARCLLDNGMDRPSISDIQTRLEEALKQQESYRQP
ncbi:receptor-like protein kinase FERONIA isoform X2 [Andrographis paniculata]|nr:receptor-like protein kinase FERONIA isoform X2 [Andrographis paniculata]